MSDLNDRICQLGQKSDDEGLQNLIQSIPSEELINFVKSKILERNFTFTWNYILRGIQESSEDRRKRFQLVITVLKELEENEVSSAHSNALIQRLCMELNKFNTEHLLQLCTLCLESIQSRKVIKLSWKELLPELLNVIVERDNFVYNEIEYTGLEYKSEFINTICMSSLSPETITSLTSIFIDMPLSKDEHLKIVNKLSQYIEKLTPQEVPPFVYQLLKLCRHQNSRVVFLRLQHYFQIRIYNNLDASTENFDVNAIESTHNQDCIEAESTVLYHIHSSATLGHESVRDYLLSLKNLTKAPEFVLNPFQLMCLFTISSINHYEETVFDIVRPCIVRAYQEELKRPTNCWVKEITSGKCVVEDVFKAIVSSSLQDRYQVLIGLVNFAFVLLNVGSALGRDVLAEKQWHLGNMILLKIIKGKRQSAPTIIQTISNRILSNGANVGHYIEFFYLLTRSLPLFMLENRSCIVELMEGLVQIEGTTAGQLLDALMPLTKVSLTIRDHLILLLRKSLYSRVTETRQMAVKGFLKLLTTLKLTNLSVLSQSSSSSDSYNSNYSLYTQISLNRGSQCSQNTCSNEALCLEVLNILKRCFMQQMEVRLQLYDGLYEAVCLNTELGVPVLNVLWLHFSQFVIFDENQLPPLDFKRIVVVRDVDAILQEPLGKLLHVIGLITYKISIISRDNDIVRKFTNILDDLCEKMAKCELIHFELDDGTNLLDNVPESQSKLIILQETLNVYEALIGYKIYSWENNSKEHHPQNINALFLVHTRLLQFSKTLSKPKKTQDGKKKKADSNKSSQSLNTTSSTKKDPSLKHRKTSDTILDLKCVIKALNLLHMPEVCWTTTSQANLVKTKCDIHRFFMQTPVNLCQKLKNNKLLDSATNKANYYDLIEIGRILYTRIVKRFKDFLDFDHLTAVLALECLQIILQTVLTHHKNNFKEFLMKIGEIDSNATVVPEFVEVFQHLFELDNEEDDYSDGELKKVPLIIITVLNLLIGQIPLENSTFSVQFLEWLESVVVNKKMSNKTTSSFMCLLFDCDIKYRKSFTLFENLVINIGEVMGTLGEEQSIGERFKIVHEGSVHGILSALSNSIKGILEDIDAIIGRMRSEYSIITYPGEENTETKMENLKTKERNVSTQLCFVVTIVTNVCNINVQPGNIADLIFKNVTTTFCTLNSFAKYFLLRCSKQNLAFQNARFEKLVKYAGKQLAPIVYKLISHIEDSQKQNSQTQTQTKRKTIDSNVLKSKVLKETRLIPKTVYEMEVFSKTIIQLSNKTKFDLSKYMGQGKVRDFRIMDLKEVLAGSTISTQKTAETDESESGEENSAPPTKRSKK